MELHARVSEIGAPQVPWNSMELLVSEKLAHFKFHGIQWNCSCQQNWRILSSMEFHGTACVSEIGALLVPWNSMELLVSLKLAYSKFHGIPWNSMELLVSAKLAHLKFHWIPWNCSYQRNWRILSSMEFHGTSPVSEIGTLQVPWNSMELLVSAKLAHHRINGIPWNFSCHQNWCTPSSMEFHGIPWNFSCHRNWRIWSSIEFHWTSRVLEIGAFQWNSMDLLVSAKLAHS